MAAIVICPACYCSAMIHPDPGSTDELLPDLYQELKMLARQRLFSESSDLTLSATDLVHELYCKLSGMSVKVWDSKSHFFALCSVYMRQILVDYARKKKAEKRGGGHKERIALQDDVASLQTDLDTILDIHRALDVLQSIDKDLAKIVEYRFFAGMTYEAISEVMGMSVITMKRRWALSKAYLLQLLAD